MIDQHQHQHQCKAELAGEEDGGIFLDMVEKSVAFFDAISMSDSVTPNPFVSTASISMKVNTVSTMDSMYEAEWAEDIDISKADNFSIDTTTSELQDARDASSTSPRMLELVLDAERQDVSPGISVDPLLDSPVIRAESMKMLDSDFEEIVLDSDDEFEDIVLDSAEQIAVGRLGAVPRQDEADREPAVLEEKQNASPTASANTNVTIGIRSNQSLFDTDSEEIDEMVDLHRNVDELSTLTDWTYSSIPFYTPYSSKPFSFAEMQANVIQKEGYELAANRRSSKSAEVVYMQRLEEIAAERSIMAQIAIKFEDAVMQVCGQEEEVLYIVVEEEDDDDDEEEEEASSLKPTMRRISEANNDMLETPIHEKANDEKASMGMAELVKTIQISRNSKLSTRDRTLAPLYERAVFDLVSLENQVMRKIRAIEIGKKALATYSARQRSPPCDDLFYAATSMAFLEVELKEAERKVVQRRESLQRLHEAFSLKTQKAIDDLQMDVR